MADDMACVRRSGCPQPDQCRNAQRCLQISTVPSWPAQPSGKVPGMFMSTAEDSDRWHEYHNLVQVAAIARIRLARDKLVTMATECGECHGKRCQFCEDTWRVIDQLEVPLWMR